jgi:hypothetical protein
VENNLVEASPGNPLHISSGSVKTRVAGNTVAGCEGGGNSVVLGGSSYGWLVEYNTIVSAHGGLQLSSGGSGHTLTRNTVTRATANYPALQYYGGSSLTVVDNNLMPSGGLAVKSQSTSPLQMNDNWWGTTDPAAIAQLIFDYYDDFELGKVTFDPPLAAPDTSAPISPPREVLKAAAPGGVLVSWAANPEADAAGYRVHRGSRTAFSFEQTEDAGEALSYLLVGAGLDDDIAVSAYDGEADGQDDWFEGHESWFTYAATAE